MSDAVNHPSHYVSHPSGVECITITEHMGFNVGNAVKYLWRADLKGDAIEDLEKARWYITREIERREKAAKAEAAELERCIGYLDDFGRCVLYGGHEGRPHRFGVHP